MLEDDLIRLRAAEPEDLEVMYEIENEPEMWEVSSTMQPYSRHMLRQYLEQSRGDFYADRQLRLMVERKSDGEVLGCADLTDFDPLHARAEIGMAMRTGHRGQGIGARTLKLLCRYAFGFLHLHQLYACVPADNENSLRMFDRCGFTRRTLLKEWLSVHTDDVGATEEYKDAVLIQCLNQK